MDSSARIMWSLLFGSFGMAYFVYGKKQRNGIALLSGVALCAFPYFVPNVLTMILVGIVFIALPFLIKY
jgi:hypothetical protein